MTASAGGALLAIESSTGTASVAIGRGGEAIAEIALTRRGGHSAALPPAIDYALRAAGLRRDDIEGVVIGGGPGSFTGLRIAGATGKAIARALDVPLLAYSGLLAAAAPLGSGGRPVCALFDARGRDVFAACYRFGTGLRVLLPPAALAVDALIATLDPDDSPVFTGDGALRHRAEIAATFGDVVAPAAFAAPRAAALLWLADAFPDAGVVHDLAAWEPDYLRASGAERIAAAKAAAPART